MSAYQTEPPGPEEIRQLATQFLNTVTQVKVTMTLMDASDNEIYIVNQVFQARPGWEITVRVPDKVEVS